MSLKLLVTGIFLTSFLVSALPQGRRQIIYYRLPQQSKKDSPATVASPLLPLRHIQDLTSLYAKRKKNPLLPALKGKGVIIYYQNRQDPLSPTTNAQNWLSKLLSQNNGILLVIPNKKAPAKTAILKDAGKAKQIEALKKLTKHKSSFSSPITKSLPLAPSLNEKVKVSVVQPLPSNASKEHNETLQTPNDSTQLPAITTSPKSIVTEQQASHKNSSESQDQSAKINASDVNESQLKEIYSHPQHEISSKKQNVSTKTFEEMSIIFTAPRGSNIMPSPKPVYKEEKKLTELSLSESQDASSSDNSSQPSSITDKHDVIIESFTRDKNNENKGVEPQESTKPLASIRYGQRHANYHVTNFTYVADESSTDKTVQPSAEATEFLPITFFNPFPLIQDEGGSERRPGLGEYSDGPGPFFHASEARQRRNDPLGSGNFEIVRGGIFRDEQGSENSVRYDRTPRGSYNRDYHEYEAPGYDNYSPFTFNLFNALSERRSITVPSRVNRLRFGGSQLIPTTADLLAMD